MAVVGGPAGLEAARVCALRGHQVTLFEAGEKLGGQVLVAARARGRSEIGEIVGWLARENAHAGVAVHLGAYMAGPDVLAGRTSWCTRRAGCRSMTGRLCQNV